MTRRPPRGTSLLEGMIASVIFLSGASSILAGSIAISRQNYIASKMNHASAVAEQVRAGLYAQGRTRLRTSGTGLFDSSRCNPALSTYAGGAAGVSPAPCFIDLDAFEASPPQANWTVVPNYPTADKTVYRRVLALDTSDSKVDILGIFISWRDGVMTRTYEQYAALYDSAQSGVGSDNNLL